MNRNIVELEKQKAYIDFEIVKALIKPSTVMFDKLQNSMLIGFFTNRDIFLNKFIPLLSVYLDQASSCIKMTNEYHQSKPE